jgi:hypothetical protein
MKRASSPSGSGCLVDTMTMTGIKATTSAAARTEVLLFKLVPNIAHSVKANIIACKKGKTLMSVSMTTSTDIT